MNETKKFPKKTQIQQGNDLVKAFYRMDAEETNLFYFALSKIEQVFNPVKFLETHPNHTTFDYNDFRSSFSLSELFKALDLLDTKNMRDLYYSKFENLLKIQIRFDQDETKKCYPLYIEATIGKEAREYYNSDICIIFNPLLVKKIFSSCYTNGQLKILGQLSKGAKNNYAQRLYFYLAMYRNTQGQKRYHNDENTWKVKMNEDYFRNLVQMPQDENTRRNNFRSMIKKIVQKINDKNFEFCIDVSFGGYGSNEMFFECTENMILKKLEKGESSAIRKLKLEINKSNEELAYYKKIYADEFESILKEQIEIQNQAQSNIFMNLQLKAELDTLEILKNKHST